MSAVSDHQDWAIPTRSAGLERLDAMTPRLGSRYSSTRNYDFGAGEQASVSRLSPWVRHRLVLEEELVRTALKHHGPTAASTFIDEVFWRTYWKGWLEMRPTVWDDFKSARDAAYETHQEDERYTQAISSQTGIDCFDAWVSELVTTGYLHNHARMWFASIWVFTLELPWALGADFFLRHLLDGDAASNTLSWRWVAGLQTQGKAYVAQAANIAKFTNGRFNPAGQLAVNPPVPLWVAPPEPRPIAFPDQIDPALPSVVMITEDDLGIDPARFADINCVGLIISPLSKQRSPYGVSANVTRFVEDAMANTVRQLQKLSQLPELHLVPGEEADLVQTVIRLGGQQVILKKTPVGPTADGLAGFRLACAQAKIPMVQDLRPWDRLCWPFATAGFFKFKKHIPSFLDQLDLG